MSSTKIGAMWLRTSKAGNKYMSVALGDHKAVMFKNDRKEKDNQPDYIIMSDEQELLDKLGIQPFEPAQQPATDPASGPAFPAEADGMNDVPF